MLEECIKSLKQGCNPNANARKWLYPRDLAEAEVSGMNTFLPLSWKLNLGLGWHSRWRYSHRNPGLAFPTSIWPESRALVTDRALRVGLGTSLVAQWLRIRLPMQGTQVRSLVQEDPTCHGATKPMHHNYWACALEPASHNYWSPHA